MLIIPWLSQRQRLCIVHLYIASCWHKEVGALQLVFKSMNKIINKWRDGFITDSDGTYFLTETLAKCFHPVNKYLLNTHHMPRTRFCSVVTKKKFFWVAFSLSQSLTLSVMWKLCDMWEVCQTIHGQCETYTPFLYESLNSINYIGCRGEGCLLWSG